MNPAWEDIVRDGGLKAISVFYGIWYKKEPLNKEAVAVLKPLYEQYPMGENSFRAWVKQRIRQVYENHSRRTLCR